MVGPEVNSDFSLGFTSMVDKVAPGGCNTSSLFMWFFFDFVFAGDLLISPGNPIHKVSQKTHPVSRLVVLYVGLWSSTIAHLIDYFLWGGGAENACFGPSFPLPPGDMFGSPTVPRDCPPDGAPCASVHRLRGPSGGVSVSAVNSEVMVCGQGASVSHVWRGGAAGVKTPPPPVKQVSKVSEGQRFNCRAGFSWKSSSPEKSGVPSSMRLLFNFVFGFFLHHFNSVSHVFRSVFGISFSLTVPWKIHCWRLNVECAQVRRPPLPCGPLHSHPVALARWELPPLHRPPLCGFPPFLVGPTGLEVPLNWTTTENLQMAADSQTDGCGLAWVGICPTEHVCSKVWVQLLKREI